MKLATPPAVPRLTKASVVDVTLNRHELRMIANVATEYWIDALIAGRSDTPWARGLGVDAAIRASWAEYAAAKAIAVTWAPCPFEERHAGDLPGGYEVRNNSTQAELTIRPRDLAREEVARRPFILVCGKGPKFNVVGWAFGYEAPEIGTQIAPDPSRPPAWFIHWKALRPLAQLPKGE